MGILTDRQVRQIVPPSLIAIDTKRTYGKVRIHRQFCDVQARSAVLHVELYEQLVAVNHVLIGRSSARASALNSSLPDKAGSGFGAAWRRV